LRHHISLLQKDNAVTANLAKMAPDDVRTAYRRWAPFYDATFGRLVEAGVKQTVERANRFEGRLLEVGVGTGLALPHYGKHLQVTGIDLSADMLVRAKNRLARKPMHNIEALLEMDATALDFPDGHFDVTTAMYVLTVVPEPAKVIKELARVTKPGGRVLIANHFSVESGLRGIVEKKMSRHAAKLGWRPEFPMDSVLVSEQLRLVSLKQLKPWGFFTLLEFVRV
jgi:phosphatidylethanolamine/phosphatidyl-N-methylethanolamine N-methyltransferase